MEFKKDTTLLDFLLLAGISLSIIFTMSLSINSLAYSQKERTKMRFGGYPAEILQPVTLEMLPNVIDKDTKGVIFIKHGCLNASRDELEAIRDKNSSDKEMYIIDGHPVKIEVKFCGR